MECGEVKPHMRVRTTALSTSVGMTVKEEHREVRKAGQSGTVLGYVPGHGGDVFFVQHEGTDEVGAYSFDEFEPIPLI